MEEDADDLILGDAIPLIEAFDAFFQATTANFEKLRDEVESAALYDAGRGGTVRADPRWDDAQYDANGRFRQKLVERELIAYVRDPESEVAYQLEPSGWQAYYCRSPGISSNFVGPDDLDNPGPKSVIRGKRRKVYFVRVEFDLWLGGLNTAAAVTNAVPVPVQDATKNAKRPKSQSGRKPDYDWAAVETFVNKTLDEYGYWKDHPVRDWRAQNDLVRKIYEFLARYYPDDAPSDSTVKRHLSPIVEAWQKRKASGSAI